MKPSHPSKTLLAIIAITTTEPAFAETLDGKDKARGDTWKEQVNEAIDSWSEENGAVITKHAREQLTREVKRAGQAGRGCGALGACRGCRGCGGCRGCAGSSLDAIDATFFVLSKLPTIQLVVQPGPPGDYSITINGAPYPATEKGLYCLAPGSVAIRIERAGKPPCNWSGTLSNGQSQKVACTF
jgi:hypothetical protein